MSGYCMPPFAGGNTRSHAPNGSSTPGSLRIQSLGGGDDAVSWTLPQLPPERNFPLIHNARVADTSAVRPTAVARVGEIDRRTETADSGRTREGSLNAPAWCSPRCSFPPEVRPMVSYSPLRLRRCNRRSRIVQTGRMLGPSREAAVPTVVTSGLQRIRPSCLLLP